MLFKLNVLRLKFRFIFSINIEVRVGLHWFIISLQTHLYVDPVYVLLRILFLYTFMYFILFIRISRARNTKFQDILWLSLFINLSIEVFSDGYYSPYE